ncbi:cox-type terminal oxidase subunit III (plasmid) [Halostagnicola larsenii XH-48]|uniref:Cox-type terminal oxidase subunit III n=1 Tax=Halostagnicola larsenii XH-48 TaxID=797299 RepID=W0JUH0_9EURY|nr:heme-copper oxidase subunit III [Halostagnicola larsenii]AHG02231.1 cox-type terminal oxidase subunit III [Halostagnicola larsenii XH-48]
MGSAVDGDLNEGTDDEHEHAPPADEDWPRGFGEASWWPLVTGVGIAGLYFGAALVLLSRGDDPLVGSVLGPIALVGGITFFLGGLYGWTYHAFVRSYWDGPSTPAENGIDLRWGMVLFLATDIMTFSAGFVYYFFIRTGSWPPGELPSLVSWIVLANTAILIASSVTLHVAHEAIRDGNRRRFIVLLGLTVLLGLVFVGGQLFEYYELLVVDGIGITDVFGSSFFALTGLHGLHVALGVILLGIVFVRGVTGQFSADRHTSVSTVSMYWHFVDLVWIILVVTLYVGSVA